MGITIAVVAQGSMGAGIGGRLHERGATVRTLLAGRSAASAARAAAAGMQPAADARALLDGADFFLSVLPPGEAEVLARDLAPTLTGLARKPVYVDCNAVSPQTALRIAALVAPTGAPFVDAGIIGGPPLPGKPGPRLYASGAAVGRALALRDWGLDIRVVDGPAGAASALKMSYAGITKGVTALGAAMMLGAARAGCAPALLAELADSQKALCGYLASGIPRMYDKAYRWVAEMDEIADFLEASPPSHDIYAAVARLYTDLAASQAETAPASDNLVATLDRVLAGTGGN